MGQLTQTVSVNAANVNLTSVGLVDWSDWGISGVPSLVAVDFKSGGGHTIPDPTLIGPGPVSNSLSNDARTVSWTNGTNTATSSSTNGIFNDGNTSGDGLQLVLPADTSVRTVYIYTGGYNLTTAATVTSSLSDGSASSQTDTTHLTGGSGASIDGVIALVYQANSSGQSLTLQFHISTTVGSNVTLQAAALASVVAGSAPTTYYLESNEYF